MSRVWFPSARVQIVLRTDDLTYDQFPDSDDETDLPNEPSGGAGSDQRKIEDVQADLVLLEEERQFISDDQYERDLYRLRRERSQIYSQAKLGNPDLPVDHDSRIITFWVTPQSCSVEKGNLYNGDKCTVTLPFKALPFDPRAFRFAAIRVLIGSTEPAEFARGMDVGDGTWNEYNAPSIVAPETTPWYVMSGPTRFVGFVDDWSLELDDTGETVTLDARDISCVMRDQPMPLSAGIDLEKPIREGIEELVRKFPGMQEIKVLYGNPVFPLGARNASTVIRAMSNVGGPVPRGTQNSLTADLLQKERELQQLLSKELPTVNGQKLTLFPSPFSQQGDFALDDGQGLVADDMVRKASKSGKAKKKSKRKNTVQAKNDVEVKVWDHILELCTKMALVPIMRGNYLFIASPRDVMSGQFGLRQMVWGHNIEQLRLARQTGRASDADNGIQMLCSNARDGRTMWARYPVKPGEPGSGILDKQGSPQPVNSRPHKQSTSKEAEDQYATFIIGGITSPAALETIAEAAYHRIARQEIKMSFSTSDLDSFSFSNEVEGVTENADLLAIQSGDSISIETIRTAGAINRDSLGEIGFRQPNNFLDVSAMGHSERFNHYRLLGFAPAVARALATSQETGDLQRIFRVNHATISFDADTGVGISVDGINFVEALNNKFLDISLDEVVQEEAQNLSGVLGADYPQVRVPDILKE